MLVLMHCVTIEDNMYVFHWFDKYFLKKYSSGGTKLAGIL